jgi:hypothetical protein
VTAVMNVKVLNECDNFGKNLNLNLRIFVCGVETSTEHVDTGLL